MDDQQGYGSLDAVLDEVADGGATIVPAPSRRDAGGPGSTAHAVIFISAHPGWVTAQLPDGDLAGPLSRRSCRRSASTPAGRRIPLTFSASHPPCPARRPPLRLPGRVLPHPRLARALRYRDTVRIWRANGGIATIGRGITGRWELSIEVDPGRRSAGPGRALAAAARHPPRPAPARCRGWRRSPGLSCLRLSCRLLGLEGFRTARVGVCRYRPAGSPQVAASLLVSTASSERPVQGGAKKRTGESCREGVARP
jgi:hypothetical protein